MKHLMEAFLFKCYEILGAIISFYSVEMMHRSVFRKKLSKNFFHRQTMRVNPSTAISKRMIFHGLGDVLIASHALHSKEGVFLQVDPGASSLSIPG